MAGEKNEPLPLDPIQPHRSLSPQVVPESNQSKRELHRPRLRHPIRGPVSRSVVRWVPAGWKPVPQSRVGRRRSPGVPLAARVSGRQGLLIVVGGGRPSIAQALQEELSCAFRPPSLPRPTSVGFRARPVPRAAEKRRQRVSVSLAHPAFRSEMLQPPPRAGGFEIS